MTVNNWGETPAEVDRRRQSLNEVAIFMKGLSLGDWVELLAALAPHHEHPDPAALRSVFEEFASRRDVSAADAWPHTVLATALQGPADAESEARMWAWIKQLTPEGIGLLTRSMAEALSLVFVEGDTSEMSRVGMGISIDVGHPAPADVKLSIKRTRHEPVAQPVSDVREHLRLVRTGRAPSHRGFVRFPGLSE